MSEDERQTTAECEYDRHKRGLEECNRRMERMDLNPFKALAVLREAEEHYSALIRMLTSVEREVEVEACDADRDAEGSDGSRDTR